MHLDVKKFIKTIMQLGVVCILLLVFSDVTQVSAARPKMVIDSRNKEDRNVRITVTATNLEEVDVAEFYYYDRKNRIHNLKISNIRKYRINKNTIILKYKCNLKQSGSYTLAIDIIYNKGTYYNIYKEFSYIKKSDNKIYVGLGGKDREVNIDGEVYSKTKPYILPDNSVEEIRVPEKKYLIKVLYRSQKKIISENEIFLKWGEKVVYPVQIISKNKEKLADNYIPHIAYFELNIAGDNEGAITVESGNDKLTLRKVLIIDGTKPKIKIDNKFTDNKTKYINHDVSIPVTIEEKNFDSGKTTVKINGKNATVSWSGSGNTHRGNIKLGEGKNIVEVQSTDKAGNKSETVKSCVVIIDKKSPKVVIKGFENGTGKGLKNGEKVPYPLNIILSDETKIGKHVVSLFKLSDDGKKKSKIDLKSTVDGNRIEYSIDDLKDDGYYTLSIYVTDYAGNSPKKNTLKSDGKRPYVISKGKVTGAFTVNRDGSLYVAEKEELFDNPIKDLNDIVIYEYNKNEISKSSVVIIDSISTKTLDSNMDTFKKLDKSDNPKYRYEYRYVIKKDNFNEGNYNIQINSTSIAGQNGTLIARTNESNSLNKMIIIDKTPPEIVMFEGTSSGKIKLKIRDDNMDENSVKILIGDKSYDLKKNDDESTSTNSVFEGDIGKNPLNAKISCSDLAGNITKGGKITIIKESYKKQILIFGGLALGAIVFIALTVITIVMVNRNNK